MLFCPLTVAVFGGKPQPWIGDLMGEIILVKSVSIIVGHIHLMTHGTQEFIINFWVFVRRFLPDCKFIVLAKGIFGLQGLHLPRITLLAD